MSHNGKLAVLIILFLACIVAITAVYVMNPEDPREISINENISQMRSFAVRDDNTGTYTEGTIFVIGTGDSTKVRIVAKLYIGPEDFGGVTFSSVKEMDPVSAICSYRDDQSNQYISAYRHIDEFGTVQVASGDEATGGGTGFIDMMFEPRSSFESKNVKTLEFIISTGSRIWPNGTEEWGSTYERITIDL